MKRIVLITEMAVYCDNRTKQVTQCVWEKFEGFFFISEAGDDGRRARKIAKIDYSLPHVCPPARPHATTRLPLDGFS